VTGRLPEHPTVDAGDGWRFSLRRVGYATLVDRSGTVPARQEAQVRKALASCQVQAITTLDDAS
jgi:hypothetical protein